MTQRHVDWEAYSYLASSSYRRRVAAALLDGEKTPSDVEADVDIQWAHVSRALGELREEGLAELLVPEDTQKGRVYGLTDTGADTIEALQERDHDA